MKFSDVQIGQIVKLEHNDLSILVEKIENISDIENDEFVYWNAKSIDGYEEFFCQVGSDTEVAIVEEVETKWGRKYLEN